MGKGRMIFVFIVSLLAVSLILFSLNQKGYEKVGRVNEYVLYYNEDITDESEYSGYILRQGFYEISVYEAIQTEEISTEYINIINDLINTFENEDE